MREPRQQRYLAQPHIPRSCDLIRSDLNFRLNPDLNFRLTQGADPEPTQPQISCHQGLFNWGLSHRPRFP